MKLRTSEQKPAISVLRGTSPATVNQTTTEPSLKTPEQLPSTAALSPLTMAAPPRRVLAALKEVIAEASEGLPKENSSTPSSPAEASSNYLGYAATIDPLLRLQTGSIAFNVPVLRGRDLTTLQRVLEQELGKELWSRLRRTDQKLGALVSRASDELGVPPEGLHARYVEAAKDLIFSQLRTDVPHRIVAGVGDAKLRGALVTAEPAVLATAERFLQDMRVPRSAAPQTYALLDQQLPSLDPQVAQLANKLHELSSQTSPESRLQAAQVEQSLSKLVLAAPTLGLLRLTRAIADAGLVRTDRGYYQPIATPEANAFPKLMAALNQRYLRGEVLTERLQLSPEYHALAAARTELMGRAAARLQRSTAGQLKGLLGSLAPAQATAILEWALQENQKQENGRLEASASSRLSSGADITKRDAREVFFDHLKLRREGKVEEDLRRNYAPDLLLASNQGVYLGREAIQASAAELKRILPADDWSMQRLYFGKDAAFETWSVAVDGRLVTGFDSFFIKDGQIQSKVIYYADTGLAAEVPPSKKPPLEKASPSRVSGVQPSFPESRGQEFPSVRLSVVEEGWRALRNDLLASGSAESFHEKITSEMPRILALHDHSSLNSCLATLILQLEQLGALSQDLSAKGGDPSLLNDACAQIDRQAPAIIRSLGTTVIDDPDQFNKLAARLREVAAKLLPGGQVLQALRDASASRRVAPRLAPPASVGSRAHETKAGRSALVVGAGPSGNAAAIELLLAGYSVDIVDARNPWNYSRPIQLSLKRTTLAQLDHLGVLERLRDRITGTRFDKNDAVTHTRLSFEGWDGVADGSRLSAAGFEKDPTVATVRLFDLETALFERALELGARPIANSTVEYVPKKNASGAVESYELVVQRKSWDGEKLSPSGETLRFQPDLAVLAEGANGRDRQTFGVSWKGDENPKTNLIAGLIDYPPDQAVRSDWHEEEGQVVRTAIMGHASGKTWSLVQLPSGKELGTQEEIEHEFRRRTAEAMGVDLGDAPLVFGGRSVFPVQDRVVSSAVFFSSPKQVIVGSGDINGVGTPLAGMGAQKGVTLDALNVRRLADTLAANDGGNDRELALRRFNSAAIASVRVWHRTGTMAYVSDPEDLRRRTAAQGVSNPSSKAK